MPATKTSADGAKQVLEQHAVGRTVRDLTVLAINALKTLDPPLTSVVDGRIETVSVDDPQRLVIHLETVDLIVNLERTGRLVWTPTLGPWTPCPGRVPPTARLLLDDGSGIDFKEPARTKRITLALARR